MNPEPEKKRLAVIGAGYISTEYHCPALKKLLEQQAEFELAAVCDLVPERARQAAELFGFTSHYSDPDDLLSNERIDAAWILIDPGHIREVAEEFMRRGIPCLIEKPPGKNSGEVRELIEIESECKVACLVGLNRRFMPLVVRARKLIESFSKPAHLIEAQMLRFKRTDEDFAYGTAVHAVDTMRYLMGEVKSLKTAKLLLPGNRRPSYLAEMEFDGGGRGRLTVLPEAGVNLERYNIHANGHSLSLEAPLEWTADYPGRIIYFAGHEEYFVQDNKTLPATFNDPLQVTGFMGECACMLESLKTGRKPTPSLAECLQSVEIAEAISKGREMSFHKK